MTRTVEDLRRARLAYPRAGLHRAPPRITPAPGDFREDGAPVVIVEDDGGFALGGNKVRQLDIILGSLDDDVTAIVSAAGPHSNLLRVTSAAAAALGREAHLLLRGEPPATLRGNQILYDLVGAEVPWIGPNDPFGVAQDEAVRAAATRLEQAGHTVRIVDVRGPDATLCALASSGLLDEIEGALPWLPTHIVLATGAGGTAAGLVLGVAARGWDTTVVAVSANVSAGILQERIQRIVAETVERFGLAPDLATRGRLHVTDAYLGDGYEIPTEAGMRAIRHTGRSTGIFLDPTYTGKAMSALLDYPSPPGARYMFVHTGGAPAIFNHEWTNEREVLPHAR